MPELPEVETTKNVLLKNIKNTEICKVEIFNNRLRWKIKDDVKKSLTKAIFKKPYRIGKYILIPTDRKKTTSSTLCIGRVPLKTICRSEEFPTISPARKLPKAVDKPSNPDAVAQTPQNARAAIGTTSLSAPKA